MMNRPVYERSTSWRPISLLSKNTLNIWYCIMTERTDTGDWRFMLYSMLPKDSVDGTTAKIILGSQTIIRTYTFETNVLSFETTKMEALETGQYMSLQDAQLKSLQTRSAESNTLINFSVEIKTDPDFLSKTDKSVQGI